MSPTVRHSPLVLAALATACGGSSAVGELRYHNAAPVKVVNDRVNVPEPPAENPFYKTFYHFEGHWHRRLTRAMEVPPKERARNVNSMGEVPDSTWFTNRIGVREISPEEIAIGPNTSGNPEEHQPWQIVSTKVGGKSPGFVIEDSRGERYLLKFDLKGFPEMETGADVVAQRLLWAFGYNVPEDYIVYFERADLQIAPDAVKEDALGNESPLTQEDVDRELAKVNIGQDGSIRALLSKFVPGEPLGPWPREGIREDDPNDLVPHQLRRDLRGQFAVFSWLDHTDIKGDNTLDTYVADPENPEHHYVVHYLLDFGKALGVQGTVGTQLWVGYEQLVDLPQMARSLVTLGLVPREWAGRTRPAIQGVGFFGAENYDPGDWTSYTPSYFPMWDADRFDNFWASKILIRFTPAQIRAAVEQGRYSDPRAVEYITRVLVERQRKTAKYWFHRVNPLDEFRLTRGEGGYTLCFVDLALRHNLEHSLVASSRYDVVGFDYEGNQTGFRQRVGASVRGEVCVSGLQPSRSRDGYTIVKIDTFRSGLDVPGVLVHLAVDPQTQLLRVIGLRRL